MQVILIPQHACSYIVIHAVTTTVTDVYSRAWLHGRPYCYHTIGKKTTHCPYIVCSLEQELVLIK